MEYLVYPWRYQSYVHLAKVWKGEAPLKERVTGGRVTFWQAENDSDGRFSSWIERILDSSPQQSSRFTILASCYRWSSADIENRWLCCTCNNMKKRKHLLFIPLHAQHDSYFPLKCLGNQFHNIFSSWASVKSFCDALFCALCNLRKPASMTPW